MQVPIEIKLTKKCGRCGLRYPNEEINCTHCTGLSDQEVEVLRKRCNDEHPANVNLGRLFLYIAVLILVGMLIASLNGI